MNNYKEQRKFWLGKLKEAGVDAPASMYPLVSDDCQEDQIDRMKAHISQLSEAKNYQEQYGGGQLNG